MSYYDYIIQGLTGDDYLNTIANGIKMIYELDTSDDRIKSEVKELLS